MENKLYTISGELLEVTVSSIGAEIKSVKNKAIGLEYMWQADEKYWNRTSPILFPFVGRLKDGRYNYKGKTYPMSQHGFARDMEHSLVSKTDSALVFVVTSDADTLEKYPFDFQLETTVSLERNCVKVGWKVKNTGAETMHFSIGAHPGFNCPINGEADKTGYGIAFGGKDEMHHHGNDVDSGLSIEEDIILPLKNHIAEITPDFFDRCTYMFEDRQTGEVSLVTREGKKYVTVLFDTPLFALWSPEGQNAPFVCIEPWFGRADAEDFAGSLEERAYNNSLEPGKVFETSYSMIMD